MNFEVFDINELPGPPPDDTAKLPNGAVLRKILDESASEDHCYICHESAGRGEEMVRLKCECPYWLHESCLARSLFEICGCPLCRTPIYKIDDEQVLGVAAEGGDVSKVTERLQNGTRPSPRYLYDSTPLMLAGKEGRKDVVRLLLAHGASIFEEDRFGKTVFHWAMSNGHEDVIRKAHELAVRHGAQVYVVVQFNGKFQTYNSVEGEQWPPTLERINQSFPLPELLPCSNYDTLTNAKRNLPLSDTEPRGNFS